MPRITAVRALVVFDIDGVVRDVGGSYRRALADTVEHFTAGAYRPSAAEIDALKTEGVWNNDWQASLELTARYFEQQGHLRNQLNLNYEQMVAFFQSRYRGPDPQNWTGYITQEPLLLEPSYLESLRAASIPWGFFSGATRGSATYVLEKRLGLVQPVLIAMEDAPGKPDPTGLLTTVHQLEQRAGVEPLLPVLFAGDTVADLYTINQARELHPERCWIGVGILPPHVQESAVTRADYGAILQAAGAAIVLENIQQLGLRQIQMLIAATSSG
ncbi:imidazoleglycerol-phosphate dehydratase [Neosynechococcus sphagnicola sy1]|uniref:Imidazoleglycerol-phosphate dehydratase n=1 Tax=Neosynechococcus sphagnicola sy1 TaxID=1497020 RepID=A0A098TTB9_9CYAN|nr:TIGR01548 family HAD-type hydrolase [Neosynechococcus sphagnicola]KGF74028.1 imidazoleglycerol-phosphate dehydratase [Neosynechococcus sphagnicola sy1]